MRPTPGGKAMSVDVDPSRLSLKMPMNMLVGVEV